MKTSIYLTISSALLTPSMSQAPSIPTPILRKPLQAGTANINIASQAQQVLPMSRNTDHQPTLADTLPLDKRTAIFASLVRDTEPIQQRLSCPTAGTTLLAPLDAALIALPRKPWERQRDHDQLGISQAYTGEEGAQRARGNLARFVAAHVLPLSNWTEGQKVSSLAWDGHGSGGGGREVWFEIGADGKRRIQPGNVEVVEVGRAVGNGEVWVLKEVLDYGDA